MVPIAIPCVQLATEIGHRGLVGVGHSQKSEPNHDCNQRAMTTVSNGAVPTRGFLTGMAQAVRALDCPWSDMTRLVLEVAPCR